jgi:(p)ppGpp synthase/HD superfamily hydrolase
MEDYRALIVDARLIATYQHRHQSYDIWPYHKHLEDVFNIGVEYGFSDMWLVCTLLHDVVEDGALSIGKIRKVFGNDVAMTVSAVTDPIDLPTREVKKKQVYLKINTRTGCKEFGALAVKLADRIANVRHGVRMASKQLKMYKDEYEGFKKALYQNVYSEPMANTILQKMWQELDDLLRKTMSEL